MRLRIAIGRWVVAFVLFHSCLPKDTHTFPLMCLRRSFAVPWYTFVWLITDCWFVKWCPPRWFVFQLKLSLSGCETSHHCYICVYVYNMLIICCDHVAFFIWDQGIHMSSTAAVLLNFTTVLFSGAPPQEPHGPILLRCSTLFAMVLSGGIPKIWNPHIAPKVIL